MKGTKQAKYEYLRLNPVIDLNSEFGRKSGNLHRIYRCQRSARSLHLLLRPKLYISSNPHDLQYESLFHHTVGTFSSSTAPSIFTSVLQTLIYNSQSINWLFNGIRKISRAIGIPNRGRHAKQKLYYYWNVNSTEIPQTNTHSLCMVAAIIVISVDARLYMHCLQDCFSISYVIRNH